MQLVALLYCVIISAVLRAPRVKTERGREATSNGNFTILYLPSHAGLLVNFPTNISQILMPRMKPRNANTTGIRLKIATVKEPPFVAYRHISNGTLVPGNNKTGSGVVIEILEEMRRRLNVEYEYVEYPDSKWGEEVAPGIWSGILGMLQRKEVDIVAGASILRFDRLAVADLSYPFYSSETGMLIRSPSRFLENRFLIVTAPFKTHVWALSILAIFVSGCVMRALCRALTSSAEVQYTWLQSTWMFFSIFVQQGLPVQPKSWSCRTLLAFWWLAALTLAATFTGNMVALFAVNKAAFPFNTREELLQHVKHKGYKVVTSNSTETWVKFLQTSQLDVFKELWREMTVKKKWINVTSLDEGIQLVKTHARLVLLGPMESLNVYAASDCDVTTTSNGIIPVMYTILLQKNSPYTEALSNLTRELVETGIMAKWMQDYHFMLSAARGDFCVFAEGATAAGEAVNVVRAQGAFWIMLAGVALGLAGIVVEFAARSLLQFPAVGRICSAIRSFLNAVSRKRGEMQVGGGSGANALAKAVYSHRTEIQSAPTDRMESARAYQPVTSADNGLKCRKKTTDNHA